MGSTISSDIMISDFRFPLGEVFRNHSPSERIALLADYRNTLEDERKKIEAFKRELPLCIQLLENASVAVKIELTRCEKSNVSPVLEELMPLKKIIDEKNEIVSSEENDVKSRDKMNWMSSVLLWDSDNEYLNNKQILKPDNRKSCKNRIAGTALWPLKKCTKFPVLPAVKEDGDESTDVPELSLGTPKIINPVEEINSSAFRSKSSCSRSGSNFYMDNHSNLRGGQQSQQITRKQRRCWSPELHRRFVDSLQQLGGAQAATPKQIRELMGVDGLSNDEVKSHLQKYRVHTRRVGASTNTYHPIVLGASWMLSQDQGCESSKQRNSRSGSPQDHTHLTGFSLGNSLTGGDSVEDQDDEKSVNHSWKNEIQLSLGYNDDVQMGGFWL